ncbi:MAG: hypothetical protein AB1916_05035 [Thermodesulfobacteriota bacterium]
MARKRKKTSQAPSPPPRRLAKPALSILLSALSALLLALLLFEALLHLAPGLAPMAVAQYLPASGKQAVAKAHGYMTKDMVKGDNLLYSYNPATARSERSFPIDENGYRNPGLPAEAVDVILLGDSLLIAEGAARDLGDLFRERGFTAYNLGMGGYGLQLELGAYLKYIVIPKVRHRAVVALICLANDFKDSENYAHTVRGQGDYTWYLNDGVKPAPERDSWLWSPGLLAGLGKIAAGWAKAEKPDTVQVTTPYATFTMERNALHPKNVYSGDYRQSAQFSYAMAGIIYAARMSDTPVLFVFMPNPANLYADFALDPSARAEVKEHYEIIKQAITEWCGWAQDSMRLRDDTLPVLKQGRDYWLLDALPPLSQAAARELVTVTPGDYHLNTRGIEVLFSAISPLVQDLLAGRAPSPPPAAPPSP